MPEFNLLHVTPTGGVRDDIKCANCPLSEAPELVTNCMEGKGDDKNVVLFVAAHPVRLEDAQGEAFSAGMARRLRELLTETSFKLPARFTYAVRCCPHSTKIKDAHWKKCKEHFKQEVAQVKPVVIVTLGTLAFRWLTGFGGGGKFSRRGFPLESNPDIPVVPFDSPTALAEADPEDYDRLRTKYVRDLTWLKQAVSSDDYGLHENVALDYKTAKTVTDVREFLSEFPRGTLVYADLETRDPNHEGALFPYPGNSIAMIGFSAGPGHARVIPYKIRGIASLTYWSEEDLQEIHALLDKFWHEHEFVGHNFIQFDQKWITVEWPSVDRLKIRFEPMLMSHLLDEEPGNHGLEDIALRYSNMKPWKSTFTVRDVQRCAEYLYKDVDAGSRVWPVLWDKLSHVQKYLHAELQVPLAHESRVMEQRGIMVDESALDRANSYLEVAIRDAEKKIRNVKEVRAFELSTGREFNPDSPADLREVLFKYCKLKPIKETETSLASTDASVLEFYETEHEICAAILKNRRAKKLKSTYVDGIKDRVQKYGPVINYSTNWAGTVTGRPSGSDPNLYNFPRADTAEKSGIDDPKVIKDIFIARPGMVLLQGDYSQAELRVLAAFSKDKALTEAYLNDVDVHLQTASKLFGVPLEEVTKAQRSHSKQVNFGLVYGKSEQGIARAFVDAAREQEKKNAEKEGREFNFTAKMEQEAHQAGVDALARHKRAHPGVWRWLAKQEQTARRQRYVETPFGRRRNFHKVDNRAIRQAYNFPIQSVGSGDLTHTAIVRCARVLREAGFNAYPILSVYDSILFEVQEDQVTVVAPIVRRIMENLGFDWLTVPMKVDLEVGKSWGALKALDLD